MELSEQQILLNELYVDAMNGFQVDLDPLSIPKQFESRQDIEIIGLFAAILAWGNRASTLNSCNKLIELFEHKPYDAILNLDDYLIKSLEGFVHRTFQSVDVVSFIKRLHELYSTGHTLEDCFINGTDSYLQNFHNNFTSSLVFAKRSIKHVANPQKGSTAKRLCMYLRWMVRSGFPDFGIWKRISPSDLYCPLDVHTARVSRELGLLKRKSNDWKSVLELTGSLKSFDELDPVKYDLALFHAGVTRQI